MITNLPYGEICTNLNVSRKNYIKINFNFLFIIKSLKL